METHSLLLEHQVTEIQRAWKTDSSVQKKHTRLPLCPHAEKAPGENLPAELQQQGRTTQLTSRLTALSCLSVSIVHFRDDSWRDPGYAEIQRKQASMRSPWECYGKRLFIY